MGRQRHRFGLKVQLKVRYAVAIVAPDRVLVDNHAHPTPPEVWELMKKVVSRVPVKGIVLERDENLPPFLELLREVEQAREIGRLYKRWL